MAHLNLLPRWGAGAVVPGKSVGHAILEKNFPKLHRIRAQTSCLALFCFAFFSRTAFLRSMPFCVDMADISGWDGQGPETPFDESFA